MRRRSLSCIPLRRCKTRRWRHAGTYPACPDHGPAAAVLPGLVGVIHRLIKGNRHETSPCNDHALPSACLALGGAASAAECGDVTIASMNWQSAEVLANLDKIILDRRLRL